MWILEENLKPLLETLSGFIHYRFDDWDWTAIRFGIINTDAGKNQWYEYPLIGEQTVLVKIAMDPGSSVVHVEMQSEPGVEEKAEVAMEIFQTYRVI